MQTDTCYLATRRVKGTYTPQVIAQCENKVETKQKDQGE
jgi:hypothetical protein